MDPDALRGRIAVVAGATRGAGRGIAAALGEAGATVICTGRTSRTRSLRSDYDRPETIEDTAELVTSHGHIDILVNDIWGAEQLKGGPRDWNRPIWEVDLDKGLRILRLAIDTHLITSHHLLPLLVDRPGGLLVEVTDGTSEYSASRYRISESLRYVGRAVAALAADPGRARWNQQSVTSAQLAGACGFTDIDGSRPDVWRYHEAVEGGDRDADPNEYR